MKDMTKHSGTTTQNTITHQQLVLELIEMMFGVLNLCKVKGSSGIISVFKKPRLFLYKKNVNN